MEVSARILLKSRGHLRKLSEFYLRTQPRVQASSECILAYRFHLGGALGVKSCKVFKDTERSIGCSLDTYEFKLEFLINIYIFEQASRLFQTPRAAYSG